MELWMDIPSFKGTYQASSEGKIRSVNHKVVRSNGRTKTIQEHILKPAQYDKYGHQMVTLKVNGIQKHRTVHSLILEAFVGERPKDKPVIRHIDGNPRNNCLENLVYGTHQENSIDMVDQGRQGSQKLDREKVLEIREKLNKVIPHRIIAKEYGVHPSSIMDIKMRRTYKHIEPFEEDE